MTVQELIRSTSLRLKPLYGERESRWLTRIAMEHVTGKNEVDLLLRSSDEATDYEIRHMGAIADRLMQHEPIQYIIGEARFAGMMLEVDPSTLIPRPETAELVDMIVADADGRADLRVLDVGTGSGCIAIALSRFLRFPEVTGIDVSVSAVAVARRNAQRLRSRAAFEVADVFTYPSRRDAYDIIVSNPPYIAECEREGMERNVLDYEPSTALFVPDDDPLLFYRAITRLAAEALTEGGRLYFEINPVYAEAMRQLVEGEGLRDVTLTLDSQRRLRFLSAVK